MDYAIFMLAKLVSHDTNSAQKNYIACAKYIASCAKRLGMKTQIITLKGKDGLARPSVLATWDVLAKETVMFLTHYDVVPAGSGWKQNPFRLTKSSGRFFGRGAADDKAGIVSFFAAIHEMREKKLKPTRNIKFLCVCDEETGGEEGIGLLVKKKPNLLQADFCATLDGDLGDISLACCGIVRGYITVKGKSGHSAFDYKSDNILQGGSQFISDLFLYKKIRQKVKSVIDAPPNPISKKMYGRFNITILGAGTAFNVIPGELKIGFDLRTTPEENVQRAKNDFRKFAMAKAKKRALKIKFEARTTGGYLSESKKYARIVKGAAEKAMRKKLPLTSSFGGTDSRYISLLRIPAYNFGPGGKNFHSNTESISLRDIEKTKEFALRLIL